MAAKRDPRDPVMLERKLRAMMNVAADWRARALNAEREVERLRAILARRDDPAAS